MFSGAYVFIKFLIFADEEPNDTWLRNDILRLRLSSSPGASQSREIFEKQLEDNNREEHKVNLSIFCQSVGTCNEAGYLLGHWDQDWGSKFETLFKMKFFAFFHNFFFLLWLGFFYMVAQSALYVLDFVKDIKFIVRYNEKIFEKRSLIINEKVYDFPEMFVVLFAMAIGFLLASEAIKVVQLCDSMKAPRVPWVLRAVLSPLQLLPILIHHQERKLQSRQRRLCSLIEPSNDIELLLADTTNELDRIRSMIGELRSTENVLEHFFQFIISLIIVSASSGFVIIDLSKSEINFAIFSCVVSLFSMIRGQVALISTEKKGQIGILSKCLLFPYMTISIVIRAGILLLSTIATYNFDYSIYYANHFSDGYMPTVITKTFAETSHLLYVLVLIIVLLLHIVLSFLIQKKLLMATKSNLKQALWSFLSPPLFLDWDFIYIQEGLRIPIPECWRRSKNSLLHHNILTLFGNIALGIPFLIFRTEPHIKKAHVYLAWSKWHHDWVLISVLSIVIVSQLILIALGFLYLRKFHPWARILNEELAREGTSDSWLPQFCKVKWFRRIDYMGVKTA